MAGGKGVAVTDAPPANSLTTPEYWDAPFWTDDDRDLERVRFDPENLEFRDVHRWLKRHLPCRTDWRFLEVGCHPGRYLWYFHQTFGYEVSGIEYAPQACERTIRLMRQIGLAANVQHADIFDFVPPDGRGFDVVASVGLIEHFRDVGPIVRRHVELLNPGGYLVLWIPNHRGINGTVLKWVQPELCAAHNHMSYRQLRDAVLANPGMALVSGGHLGRFHLAPSNFCPNMQARLSTGAYRWVERLHRYGMRFGQWLPNTSWLSPYCGVIARKGEPS
jgi:SAM-dependent methyltransferase